MEELILLWPSLPPLTLLTIITFTDIFQEVSLRPGNSCFKEHHRLSASQILRARLLSLPRSLKNIFRRDQVNLLV